MRRCSMCTIDEKLKQMQQVLQEKKMQPIFFIGSGLSRRYLESPNWKELLEKIAEDAKCNYTALEETCNHEYEKIAQELEFYYFRSVSCDDLKKTKRREILRNKISEIFNECKEKYIKTNFLIKNEDFNKEINDQLSSILNLNEQDGPKKIQAYANNYDDISKEIEKHSYCLKKIIEIQELQKTNPKAIITTNYDTMLEDIIFENKCKRHIGQKGFSCEIDDSEHEIDLYKIHGCITEPESIIITKEDYDNFFQKSKYLYSKIFTLFWENPIIFMGYSVSDRNIKDILTVIIEIMSDEDKKEFLKRIWIVDYVGDGKGEHIENKEIELLNGEKINVTCFCLENYYKIFSAINKVVLSQRFGELEFTISKNVIELLIEPLYQQQDKLKVVIRELLQNALDACKKKRVHAKIEIIISEDNGHSFLKIVDNGIGMNLQEIRENFLTVGKTSKRSNCEGLIGKYGIGILSIFLIGDYAEVYTKKKSEEMLSFKIDNKDDKKRVEWLEPEQVCIEEFKGDSFTAVKIRLNNHLDKEDQHYMEKLGLEMYVTKPENSISVKYMDREEEIPKVDKNEWFKELSDNIKLYMQNWLDIDESEFNLEEKELVKRLSRSGYIFYNDMLSSVVFERKEYKQLNNISIPFVMLDFNDVNTVEADIKTNLSRSSVQILGNVMKTIAGGIYKLEIEKIVKIICNSKEALEENELECYDMLKEIRNNSAILRDNIDVLLYENKLLFSKSPYWKHINIWGSERFIKSFLKVLQDPILHYNLLMDKSLVSNYIKNDNILCISVNYLDRYICNATSPQNGLRKEALIKILHFLGFTDKGENDLSTSIWQYVRDNRKSIREAYIDKASNGLLWLKKTYDISDVDVNNDSLIVFETSYIDKNLDDDFYEILQKSIDQKSLNNFVAIHI